MLRIAVTGCTGFIGRALVSYLLNHGIFVVPVSRDLSISSISGINVRHVDSYRDTACLSHHFTSCDAVIHLAGLAHQFSVSQTFQSLQAFRIANVDSLVHVARAAANVGVSRVVYLSSIGVNGNFTAGTPFTECDQPHPVDLYAISKYEAEIALCKELQNSITDWVVLRPPLVYGPHCPGNLERLFRLVFTYPVLPFGLLSSRRSLISIQNLVSALLLSVQCHSLTRQVFVICDQQDIKLSDMFSCAASGLGVRRFLLLNVPCSLLSFVFSILRKRSLWLKLSSELLIDPSLFVSLTDWRPSGNPHHGITNAASVFSSMND